MSRKSVEITIGHDAATARDAGKKFLITELPAWQAEAWGSRAMGAMTRSGLKITDAPILTGMAAIAVYGTSSFMAAPWEEIQPLLAEMMGCIKIVEPKVPGGRDLVDEDIEEVATRLRLREEVLKLHTGFSLAANLLAAVVQVMSAMEGSLNTPISPTLSDPSSQPDLPPSKNSKRTIA